MANLLSMATHHLGRSDFGDPKNAGNLMSMDEAHALLIEWVPNERLRLHMKQVAAVMKAWAIEKENAGEQTALKWELAGLLHDADWEKYPDDHCRIIIEELEKRNIDPDVIHCIASHVKNSAPGFHGADRHQCFRSVVIPPVHLTIFQFDRPYGLQFVSSDRQCAHDLQCCCQHGSIPLCETNCLGI